MQRKFWDKKNVNLKPQSGNIIYINNSGKRRKTKSNLWKIVLFVKGYAVIGILPTRNVIYFIRTKPSSNTIHCRCLYFEQRIGSYSVKLSFMYDMPESIDCFINDQAFLSSYDLAPPPHPHYTISKLSNFLSLPMCRRSSILMGEWGVGGGRGCKSYDGEKA